MSEGESYGVRSGGRWQVRQYAGRSPCGRWWQFSGGLRVATTEGWRVVSLERLRAIERETAGGDRVRAFLRGKDEKLFITSG